MWGALPDDLPVEGANVEKSKLTLYGISLSCSILLVAHFFAQDIVGCASTAALGLAILHFTKSPTYLSISTAIIIGLSLTFLSGFVCITILAATQMQLWQSDYLSKFEFSTYFLDLCVAVTAMIKLNKIWIFPTTETQSLLPHWVTGSYGAITEAWAPYSGQAHVLGAAVGGKEEIGEEHEAFSSV